MEPKTTNIFGFSVTYFNKEELKILKKEIFQNEIYKTNLKKNHPLIFDLGSNIGLSVLYFKNKYPDSTILSFEPNPNVFPLLEENVQRNQLKDIELFNLALGSREADRELYIDSSGLGAFSTASFNKNAWNGKQKSIPIKVKTVPLSKYINSDIDLIKMDLEGTEMEVLKDLNEKKKFKYIRNILIEYHPINQNRLKKIVQILEAHNFDLEYFQEGRKIESNKEELLLVVAQKRIN